MEIAPLINNAVAVVTASASAAVSASASVSSSSQDDNVNNLALLASLTLQKVLNINNNNNQHIKNHNHNHSHISDSKQHEQQKQQQQPQPRRNLDIKSENDVLNQLLKTGAVFTATPTAPIAIERKKQTQQQQHQYAQQPHQQQQQYSAQKQRLNSSISSTHSSTSTNSSYGSSSSEEAAGTSAPSATGAGASVTSGASTARASTTKASSNKLPEKSKIPSDILDDLASRFIINVPDMELNNLIRMCFQIELAHWFYLDFFCAPETGEDGETPKCVQRKLPSVGIKQFAMQLFQHIPFLNKHFGTVDQILDEWKNYKLSVPTYGAILVSEDHNHCLLVQSYFARNSWGFPKGKINENEDPAHCATREVYEETGFDITDLIDANDYIEAFINYQYTRLYVVRNIPMDTQFAPRTRNEIKCCDWFRIDALPVNKNDAISKAKLGKTSNSFFMIMPFVKRLKKWVNDRKAGIEPRRRKCSGQQSPKAASPTNMNGSCKKDVAGVRNESRRQRHKSMGDLDGVKLNNLNGKGTAGAGAGAGLTAPASATAAINSMNICNSNGKRNKQNAAAGSNQATPTTIATPVTSNGAVGGGTVSSKRQLFHSQSQNDAQQSASNEKQIVSSFDLIRKEKQQQLKAAKAQKQQQQQQRLRTKSQSDKQYNPQQPVKILGQHQPTTGMDLIAMLSAAAAAQKTSNKEQQTQQQQHQQQRPRPASVSLNLGAGSATTNHATPSAPDAQDMHKLQRMASGTNLRILKRAQSQQPQQHHQQQLQLEQQQQQLGTDFTPNFNSWTNFSFTKNFIANVFC
ncbi:uncharacterized protein LOC6539613 isoform X1 [Drosophila yakuba]|uniref:uncharacterized protein LOC6539613 isoform X1 n=1 Tax=Drosophila yakuba TaxID=7245 RepID=UPI001930756D|nr:uncharacterized protein LOC6539613 isoform X1 [Drosophila yakuba]